MVPDGLYGDYVIFLLLKILNENTKIIFIKGYEKWLEWSDG